jgi:hypothetical protein
MMSSADLLKLSAITSTNLYSRFWSSVPRTNPTHIYTQSVHWGRVEERGAVVVTWMNSTRPVESGRRTKMAMCATGSVMQLLSTLMRTCACVCVRVCVRVI